MESVAHAQPPSSKTALIGLYRLRIHSSLSLNLAAEPSKELTYYFSRHSKNGGNPRLSRLCGTTAQRWMPGSKSNSGTARKSSTVDTSSRWQRCDYYCAKGSTLLFQILPHCRRRL